MKITLIYNPNSGGSETISPKEIVILLEENGFDPFYARTESLADLDDAVSRAEELIFIAGGDGSVREVAIRLMNLNLKIPLCILPLGTANNISRTLGIEGSPERIISGLAEPVTRIFDVGRVRAPWGEHYFLEAFGIGLYAEALAKYEPEKGKSIIRSITTLTETISNYQLDCETFFVDEEEISIPYVLLEVMNTPAFGPRIKLAPNATPSDGNLDVIGISNENRDSYIQYLFSLLQEDMEKLPSVEVFTGKLVRFAWTGMYVHVDAEVHPSPDEAKLMARQRIANGKIQSTITIDVLPAALEFLLPQKNIPATDRTEVYNQIHKRTDLPFHRG